MTIIALALARVAATPLSASPSMLLSKYEASTLLACKSFLFSTLSVATIVTPNA